MQTFSDLIDRFGAGELAQVLGVTRKHVSVMRARKAIPPLYWGALVEAAPRFGISDVDDACCRRMHAARRTVVAGDQDISGSQAA